MAIYDYSAGHLASGNGVVVALYSNRVGLAPPPTTTYFTSTNGTAWTTRALPSANTSGVGSGKGLVFSSRLGLFFYSSGIGQIYSSPDGIAWTLRYSSLGVVTLSFVEQGGLLLSADITKAMFLTSVDGITWLQRQPAIAGGGIPGSASLIEMIALPNGSILFLTNSTNHYVSAPYLSAVVGSSSAPLTVSRGGTGQVTIGAALNALLPAQAGQTGKLLQTDGTGASWAVVGSAGAVSALIGDVTASGSGSVVATVARVGGALASAIAAAVAAMAGATDANTALAIVKRDAASNFSAGIITANLAGNASGLSATLAVTSGGTGQITAAAALAALLPSQAANTGKFLSTDGTNASWAAVAGGGGLSGMTAGRVQYAGSATALADDAGLVWDPTLHRLVISTSAAVYGGLKLQTKPFQDTIGNGMGSGDWASAFIFDTYTAYSNSPRTGFVFGGAVTADPTASQYYGSLVFGKENATIGDAASFFTVSTRAGGGSSGTNTVERFRINSTGGATFSSFVGVNGVAGSSTFPLNVGGAILANNVANNAAYGLAMSNGVDATWTVIPVATGQVRMKTDAAGRWMSIADGAGTTDVFAIRGGHTLVGSTTDNGTDALQVTGKATFSSKVGIGIANPGEPLDVYGAPTADGALSVMMLLANNATSHSSNPSSGIDFGVNIAIGAVNGVAGIAGGKENGTPGNTAGFLAFYSQADAGAKVEQGRFDSSGRFVTKSGRIRNRTPHTVDYAALVTDDIIAYTTLAASRTVTLPIPDVLNRGQEYVIQDESGSAAAGNSITIATTGGSVFGANTITTAYGGRTVYSNGVNWYAR